MAHPASPQEGTAARYVYTYPSKKALRAIMTKVKAACLQNVNHSLADLLRRLNPMLRGWTAYFRPGVSNVAFEYLRSYSWHPVMRWIRKKHRRRNCDAATAPCPTTGGGPQTAT